MTKATLICIAAFAAAIATTAKNLAEGETTDTGAPAAEPTPTKRRGRAPTETEAPKDPAPAGKTARVDDQYSDEALKLHIHPLVVEEGRGAEVKALITKHGGTKISDLPEANRPAFYRDIEALKM